jgi:hypothetical protein
MTASAVPSPVGDVLSPVEERALSEVRAIVAAVRARGVEARLANVGEGIIAAGGSAGPGGGDPELNLFCIGGATFSVKEVPDAGGSIEVSFITGQ